MQDNVDPGEKIYDPSRFVKTGHSFVHHKYTRSHPPRNMFRHDDG